MGIVLLPAGRLAGSELLAAEEIASRVVAAAVRSPSVHNTQPWWFGVHGTGISLRADPGRPLMAAHPRGCEMMISRGAALFTGRLGLRLPGCIPGTGVLPDPARPLLVAEVSWQRRAAPAGHEQRLFDQVPRRRTHRGEAVEVTDPAELARVRELPLYPRAPGAKTRHVRILPAALTGRRISVPRRGG